MSDTEKRYNFNEGYEAGEVDYKAVDVIYDDGSKKRIDDVVYLQTIDYDDLENVFSVYSDGNLTPELAKQIKKNVARDLSAKLYSLFMESVKNTVIGNAEKTYRTKDTAELIGNM